VTAILYFVEDCGRQFITHPEVFTLTNPHPPRWSGGTAYHILLAPVIHECRPMAVVINVTIMLQQ